MYRLHQKQDQLDKRLYELILHCAEAVHRDYPDAKIILYGSQARGQAKPQSDLDVLILLSSDISSEKKNGIHDRLYEIGLECDIVISAIIKSISYWGQPISKATLLYQSIQSEGILVA